MEIKAAIFDLDLTLIASAAAEPLRKSRRWGEVYPLIPSLTPYAGVPELLAAARTRGLKTAIVTSSPGSYCDRVVRHWGWRFDAIVCYHDTNMRKPHAAPTLLALKKLRVEAGHCVSIGDHRNDILSAKASGVFSIGALWGCSDPTDLKSAQPDLLLADVHELATFLGIN